MRNLDTSLSRKEEALSECNTEKHNLEERIKSLESIISEKDKTNENLQEMNVSSWNNFNDVQFETNFHFAG